MLKFLFAVILLNSVVFLFGNGDTLQNKNLNCPEALKRFSKACLTYSSKFLKSYADSTPQGTGFLSPVSLILNTATLTPFAKGVTQTELFQILNVTTIDEVICIANNLYNDMTDLPDCVTYRITKNIFGSAKLPFTERLKKFQKKVIRGLAKNLDFTYSSRAAEIINAIVASETDNRIPNVIEDDSILNKSTQLVWANGNYFEADWKIEFVKSDHLFDFKVSPTKSEPQTFMYQNAEYLWAHSDILGAEVIQIDFCCDSFYLWEILPDCHFGENVVIEKMADNIDWFYEILQKFKPTYLHLHVPKVDRCTPVNSLAVYRNATGISSLYNDKTINLKGAIKGDIPAAVSIGRQSTYVKTHYKGGPVPDGSRERDSEFDKVVNADYPHIWITFRNDIVYFIGVDRSPVDRS